MDSSDEDDRNEKEKITFNITFSIEDWKSIQPREKTYIEKRGSRTYNILIPYEWSNIVQDSKTTFFYILDYHVVLYLKKHQSVFQV